MPGTDPSPALVRAIEDFERWRLTPRSPQRTRSERGLLDRLLSMGRASVVHSGYRYTYSRADGWISRVPVVPVERPSLRTPMPFE